MLRKGLRDIPRRRETNRFLMEEWPVRLSRLEPLGIEGGPTVCMQRHALS